MIERLAEDGEQSIRYNLMAIVPDRRIEITHKLGMLRTNRSIVTEALEQLKKNAPPSSNSSTKKDNGEEAEKEPSDVPNIDILQRLSLRGEVYAYMHTCTQKNRQLSNLSIYNYLFL